MQPLPENKEPNAASAPECMVISEKQFMRDHSIYSALSSWLFALAGATNIGLLSVLAARVLTAVEQDRPIFKSNKPGVEPVMSNKKYNRVALGMMAFGGMCMAVSNWLESKKVVTEWQLGAGKLQRKANIAEERAHVMSAHSPSGGLPAAQADTVQASVSSAPVKQWADSVQSKTAERARVG